MVQEAIRKADVLIEALPYIKRFHRKIVVVKYGGSILSEEKVRKSVLEDIAFLRYMGMRPILVHGGGPNITERLKDMKVESEFIDGVRVTDRATLSVVEEELSKLNDLIVEEINQHGAIARGIKRDKQIIFATKKMAEKDLGFVGHVSGFDKEKLEEITKDSIPVISPMGLSQEGVALNINADEVAFFIAAGLEASKLVLLTNVLGVMRNAKDTNSLISTLTVDEADELMNTKVIDEGMIPKVKAAIRAIQAGVEKAHIIDAKVPHAIMLEIFTDQGVGTELVQ